MSEELSTKLGYEFKNSELLAQALTHKSFHNENPKKSNGHNERLEFLGDAVLDLALSDYLMKRYPDFDEGDLSKIRASLVNEAALAEMAREFEIEKYIRLGKGEFQSGGSLKPRLIASTLEAIIGAIYQDSDFVTAYKMVQKIFDSRVETIDLENHFKSDYKTRLQERMQELLKQIPIYELEREEGPDHDKTFFVILKLEEQIIARGSGRSKKQAEQDAARAALEKL